MVIPPPSVAASRGHDSSASADLDVLGLCRTWGALVAVAVAMSAHHKPRRGAAAGLLNWAFEMHDLCCNSGDVAATSRLPQPVLRWMRPSTRRWGPSTTSWQGCCRRRCSCWTGPSSVWTIRVAVAASCCPGDLVPLSGCVRPAAVRLRHRGGPGAAAGRH